MDILRFLEIRMTKNTDPNFLAEFQASHGSCYAVRVHKEMAAFIVLPSLRPPLSNIKDKVAPALGSGADPNLWHCCS